LIDKQRTFEKKKRNYYTNSILEELQFRSHKSILVKNYIICHKIDRAI